MAGWHHWLYGHEFEWLWELVMDREAWRAKGSQRVRHNWAAELNWSFLFLLTRGWVEILFLNMMNEGSLFKFPLFCILGLWIIIFEKWGLQIQPGVPLSKIVSERVWERQYKYFIAGNSHESLQKTFGWRSEKNGMRWFF